MEFVIVSGLSGGGKSCACKTLEDIGFYCVDNMPVELIPQFAQLCRATKSRYERVAIVTDVRAGMTFDGLFLSLDKLVSMAFNYTIVYVEASTETLIRRYKETRRAHPLMQNGVTLTEAIQRERTLLEPVRNRAAYIFDTTDFSTMNFRRELKKLFSGNEREKSLTIEVLSFGFKHGIPQEADFVFDVRFLPNPYYIEELKHKTGLEAEVRDFVFSYQQTKDYVAKLEDMLSFTLPLQMEEGKSSLTIAVGCTGGHHRSVAIAAELGSWVRKLGFETEIRHRDIGRR